MRTSLVRGVSRLLILTMLGLPLQAGAGLVGTEAALPAAAAQPARDALLAVLERDGAARQLQALGVSPEQARARIAALTDAEAAQLARGLAALPAGADGAGLGIVLVIIFLFWRFIWVPSHEEEKK